MSLRSLPVLAGGILLATSCFDFDYTLADGTTATSGATSSQATSGASGIGPTSTGTTVGPGVGGAAGSSTGEGAASSTGEGAGAPGSSGAGGGGGGTCTLRGEGRADVDVTWSIALGPLQGPDQTRLQVATALDGERTVVGVASYTGGAALGDDPVEGGDQPGYFLAWADDGGEVSEALRVESLKFDPDDELATFDIGSRAPGRVLVAGADQGGFSVVEVDLCTRAETPLVQCTGAAYQSAQVEGNASGAWAFALNTVNAATAECEVFPPGCPVPSTANFTDTLVWTVEADGTCRSTSIADPTEPGNFVYQSAPVLTLTDDGDALLIGHYDGFLFQDTQPIETTEDYGVFHKFFVRLQARGGALVPVQAFDLGRLSNEGRHRAQPLGTGALFAATVDTSLQPVGPFDPPLGALTALGGSDVFFARVTSAGTASSAFWGGSTGNDGLGDLSRSPDGFAAAVTARGNDVEPGCTEGGCALFAAVSETGVVGDIVVVDAPESGAEDFAHSAFLVGENIVVVGSTSGSFEKSAPPPTDSFTLYMQRRSF